MNVGEGLHLQHDADAAVAGTLVPGAQQPAIDFLALVDAGCHGVAEGGLRVVDQIAQQPQFQRMHASDIALIRQAVGARAVVLVQTRDALIGEFFLWQLCPQERGEGGLIGLRQQVTVHGAQAHRGLAQAADEGLQTLLRRLALIFAPETQEEGAPFLVGEALQVFLAAWVLVVLEQFGAVLIGAVAHQVAHQADEGQVDRLAQGFTQGRVAAVVLAAEVTEGVQAAAGEEAFVRAGRIASFQRSFQHAGQIGAGVGQQIGDCPAAQVVLVGDLDVTQLGRVLVGVALMQLGDDLQISRQHP